eukprot:15464818-Alexandrium_andersonii.AAC.1
MEILGRQVDTSQVRIFVPLGIHLEMLCNDRAPQGRAWLQDEMPDYRAQAPDFERRAIPVVGIEYRAR